MSCSVIIIGAGARRAKGPLTPCDLPPLVHVMSQCPACVGGGFVAYDAAAGLWTQTCGSADPRSPTTEMYVLLFIEMGSQTGLARASEWITVTESDWLKSPDKKVYTIDHTVT